ncbi:hypothetical protein BDD12DRAFT_500607 [Trichophaea hybrida]|nr:hypothetical protein BDD12DRAFT_500607 [Trichophaea hybrida]
MGPSNVRRFFTGYTLGDSTGIVALLPLRLLIALEALSIRFGGGAIFGGSIVSFSFSLSSIAKILLALLLTAFRIFARLEKEPPLAITEANVRFRGGDFGGTGGADIASNLAMREPTLAATLLPNDCGRLAGGVIGAEIGVIVYYMPQQRQQTRAQTYRTEGWR